MIDKHRPIVLMEKIKVDAEALHSWLDERGYRVVDAGLNLLAIHRSDLNLSELQIPKRRRGPRRP